MAAQFQASAKIITDVTKKLTELDRTNKNVGDIASELKTLQNVLQNPKLQLRVYKHNGYWKPLNTKKDIEEIEEEGLPDVFKENEK